MLISFLDYVTLMRMHRILWTESSLNTGFEIDSRLLNATQYHSSLNARIRTYKHELAFGTLELTEERILKMVLLHFFNAQNWIVCHTWDTGEWSEIMNYGFCLSVIVSVPLFDLDSEIRFKTRHRPSTSTFNICTIPMCIEYFIGCHFLDRWQCNGQRPILSNKKISNAFKFIHFP